MPPADRPLASSDVTADARDVIGRLGAVEAHSLSLSNRFHCCDDELTGGAVGRACVDAGGVMIDWLFPHFSNANDDSVTDPGYRSRS